MAADHEAVHMGSGSQPDFRAEIFDLQIRGNGYQHDIEPRQRTLQLPVYGCVGHTGTRNKQINERFRQDRLQPVLYTAV